MIHAKCPNNYTAFTYNQPSSPYSYFLRINQASTVLATGIYLLDCWLPTNSIRPQPGYLSNCRERLLFRFFFSFLFFIFRFVSIPVCLLHPLQTRFVFFS